MIELYVVITLLGLGYIMNQVQTPETAAADTGNINPKEISSQNNAYDTTRLDQVKQDELVKATDSYQKSLENPLVTKVINRRQDVFVESRLTGTKIPKEEFIHNNMVPFYRGNLKQDVKRGNNSTLLESFGAQGYNTTVLKSKKEVETFFQPQSDITSINGMSSKTDVLRERYSPALGKIQNNVLPFEQVKVAPGLNQGYCSNGVGGFQQFEIEEVARKMYKDTDELRAANKPKVTFEGRVVEGQKGTTRGKVGEVKKNRPDTYYEQTPDMYLRTTAAVLKESNRPEYPDKPTAREDTSTEYQGVPYDKKVGVSTEPSAIVKEPFRSTLTQFNQGPATIQGAKSVTDYGKSNILIYTNERDVTTTRTYQGNVSTLVKALVAPLLDAVKISKKEYYIENERQFGNMNVQIPNKITVKDPDDVLRTTIKETLIHDSRLGNLKGHNKITTKNPNDIAKTTIKETLIHDTVLTNIVPKNRGSIVYNPDEVAKTTIRQTVKNFDYSRNVQQTGKGGIVYDPNNTAKTTIKETTIYRNIEDGNVGNLEKRNNGYLQENYEMKETEKEIYSAKDYIGGAGIAEGLAGNGYQIENYEMKSTEKENPEEYIGIAVDAQSKQAMSYDDIYNAHIDDLKESTIVGNMDRSPTLSGPKQASGVKQQGDLRVKKMDQLPTILNAPKPMQNTVDICNQVGVTRLKKDYDMDTRLDPIILEPLKDNPFAKSIV